MSLSTLILQVRVAGGGPQIDEGKAAGKTASRPKPDAPTGSLACAARPLHHLVVQSDLEPPGRYHPPPPQPAPMTPCGRLGSRQVDVARPVGRPGRTTPIAPPLGTRAGVVLTAAAATFRRGLAGHRAGRSAQRQSHSAHPRPRGHAGGVFASAPLDPSTPRRIGERTRLWPAVALAKGFDRAGRRPGPGQADPSVNVVQVVADLGRAGQATPAMGKAVRRGQSRRRPPESGTVSAGGAAVLGPFPLVVVVPPLPSGGSPMQRSRWPRAGR